MIARDSKVVIVKQGRSLREITRYYITRLRGKKESEVDGKEEELEMVWKRVMVRRGAGKAVLQEDRREEVILR